MPSINTIDLRDTSLLNFKSQGKPGTTSLNKLMKTIAKVAISLALLSGLILPAGALTLEQKTIVPAVCHQIKADFQLNLDPKVINDCYSYGEDGKKLLQVSFNVAPGTQTKNQANYAALVQNRKGEMVPDQSSTTISELKTRGIYTGDLPEDMQVNVHMFCENDHSCNSYIRAIQKTPEGMTVAEANGWSIQEVFSQIDEFKSLNPEDTGIEILARNLTESISPSR